MEIILDVINKETFCGAILRIMAFRNISFPDLKKKCALPERTAKAVCYGTNFPNQHTKECLSTGLNIKISYLPGGKMEIICL